MTGMTTPTQPARSELSKTFALELDVLRGIAAVLMIFNHAGFWLLDPSELSGTPAAITVFLGGFAPVVFFFATGFGIALSRPNGRLPEIASLLWKAALLVVADQFFFWTHGFAWGLDFFSFIAIASVVVTVVARFRRAAMVCVALIVLLIGLRYGLGPGIRSNVHQFAFFDWVVGANAVERVSYPLSPWMVYPLLGFLLGRLYKSVNLQSPNPRNLWFRHGSIVALGLFAMALLLALFNNSFFRWGSVSFAFFVLSLGIVLASGLLSMYLTISHRRFAEALALRGVASFAVIPLHYAMLAAGAASLGLPVGQLGFAALAVLIIVVSFRASFWFAAAMASASVASHRQGLLPTLLLLLAVLALVTLLEASRALVPVALLLLLGQLVVAAILGMRPGKPAPVDGVPLVTRQPAALASRTLD